MDRMTDIIWVDVTDSTNAEVGRCQNIDNLSVLAARTQTAGRGQRGNVWLTEPGKNLTFSIYVRYEDDIQVPADQEFSLCEAVALSISDYLRERFGLEAAIKWPNDIYVNGRKICGILIEHRLNGKFLESSVIGIGLNVNQKVFPPELPNATSITLETGQEYNLENALEDYLEFFYERLLALSECDAGELIHRDYLSRQFRKNLQI